MRLAPARVMKVLSGYRDRRSRPGYAPEWLAGGVVNAFVMMEKLP